MSSSPVTLVGNITRDPELRFMDSGTAKTEFSIASNHNWRDADGEWQQKTSYFDCVVWRKAAEDVARLLEKGVGVVVTGRLEQRSWDDKETGQKRSKVEVVVDEVGILTRSIETFDRRRASEDSQKTGVPQKAAARKKPASEDEPF